MCKLNRIKGYFKNCKVGNLYSLEGTVPFFKAIPYSLEHVFAMLISNITPILLILTNAKINSDPNIVTMGIQNSLLLAGVGSLIQFFPIWKAGSKLPIFVGMNFAFMSVINYIGVTYGYNAIASSVIIGSLFFIIVSLFLKKVLKFIPKISSSIVVFMLGLSLIISQLKSIPLNNKDFYSISNIMTIVITISVYILFNKGFKGKLKCISLIASLIGGFVTAILFKVVDFDVLKNVDVFTYPKIVNILDMDFNLNAIITVCIMFLVSITDVIGAVELLNITDNVEQTTTYMASTSLGMGIISLASGFLGCIPLTSFAQNVGIVKNTKVINRYTLAIGAVILIILSFFPIVGTFIQTIPSLVISIVAIMIFISILCSGVLLLKKIPLNLKNIIIIVSSILISLIFMLFPKMFSKTPNLVESILTNSIAISFIISLILYYIIPNKKEESVQNE